MTLDALEPFRIKPEPRLDDDVLPYLADPVDSTYNIQIKMDWTLGDSEETFECASTNLSNTYWTFKQMVRAIFPKGKYRQLIARQLTTQTLAGCPLRAGDLIGTGVMTGRVQNHNMSQKSVSDRPF